MNRCITCGKPVNRNKAHMQMTVDGTTYLACCPLCQSEFEKNPAKYVQPTSGHRGK